MRDQDMLCFKCRYRIERVTYHIYVSELYTESKSARKTLFISDLCLREYSTSRTLSERLYSKCSVTLSHLSLHHIRSVCFPFMPRLQKRSGLSGLEQLNFGCFSFAEKRSSRFSTVYCSIIIVIPLIKDLKPRPLLFKPDKGPWIRTPIFEIWQCAGLMWTLPRGIEMKMLVEVGWWDGIKNESGRQDSRSLRVLPSHMDTVELIKSNFNFCKLYVGSLFIFFGEKNEW